MVIDISMCDHVSICLLCRRNR